MILSFEKPLKKLLYYKKESKKKKKEKDMSDFDDCWVVNNLTGEMIPCEKETLDKARKCFHCERGMTGEPYHFFNDYCAICTQRVVLYLRREGFPTSEKRIGPTWFRNGGGIQQEISPSLGTLRDLSSVCYETPEIREYFRNFGQFLKKGDGITVTSVLADFSSEEDDDRISTSNFWFPSFCKCTSFASASLLPPE